MFQCLLLLLFVVGTALPHKQATSTTKTTTTADLISVILNKSMNDDISVSAYNENSSESNSTTSSNEENSSISNSAHNIEHEQINSLEALMEDLQLNQQFPPFRQWQPLPNIIADWFKDEMLDQTESDHAQPCLLSNIRKQYMWWINANGTLTNTVAERDLNILDLSNQYIYKDKELLSMLDSQKFHTLHGIKRPMARQKIQVFSAAYNHLKHIPSQTLSDPRIKKSLLYLSLMGNNFHSEQQNKSIISFPPLLQLHELDLSNCRINTLSAKSFAGLPNLRTLHLSFNLILEVPVDVFLHVPLLSYLDLSYMNKDKNLMDNDLSMLSNGLKIDCNNFISLKNLNFLDLSHTRLSSISMLSLSNLPKSMQILSLCYTCLPVLSKAQFDGTSLIALDLSGNSIAGDFISADVFDGLSHNLQYLLFRNANIKHLNWLGNLNALQALKLSTNSISNIFATQFNDLPQLRLLDLHNNRVGNWYKRVFNKNAHLHLLDVRGNSLNIITDSMLKDFIQLDYLALSDNNFICDCILRSLIDLSANNQSNVDCITFALKHQQLNLTPYSRAAAEPTQQSIDMRALFMDPYVSLLRKSREQLLVANAEKPRMQFSVHSSKTTTDISKIMWSHRNFSNIASIHVQLFDYNTTQYYCYNNSKRIIYKDYKCRSTKLSMQNVNIKFTHNVQLIVSASVASGLLIAVLAGVAYWKRWHIHYYYVAFKSATLWSMQAKMANDQFATLDEAEPQSVYDIFISYCQRDRDWVLDQLLPNMEKNDQISLCLHERDFEIGVTILDNIISSMDRSRALMLIVSQQSLVSHWCQFEMHLAQHRMIEAAKEHLLLVLLEDIPRNKRPKTLQYLMDVKTYIKWPGASSSAEEQKVFWHRIKRTLAQIGLIEARNVLH